MAADVHSRNAYKILGVPRDADVAAIRRAFRKLAMKHHPDAVPPDEKDEAAAVFARINQAHELLRDPEKRRKYDALLERGIEPDISKDVGEAAEFESLAAILGEIKALNIDLDADKVLSNIDAQLRDELLLPNLIRGEYVRESVLDVLAISGLTARKYEIPEGNLQEGWLVVTELRLTVLLKYVHEYESGNTRYTNTYWRARSFPYASVEKMLVVEEGRAFKSYQIELADEDGTEMDVTFTGTPRLTALFLVANRHQLPLTIRAKGTMGDEYGTAVGASLVAPLLWAQPFFWYSVGYVVWWVCGSDKHEFNPFKAYPHILQWMNDYWLTLIMFYLSPLILLIMCLQVYAAWSLRRAEDVLGPLPLDFASGSTKADWADEAGPREPKKEAPPPPKPVKKKEDAPPRPVPAVDDAPIPLVDAAAVFSPQPPPPPRPEPVRTVPPPPPAEVAVPEAIRQAMGLPDPPPAPAAAAAKVPAFCGHCGAKYMVPPGIRAMTTCRKCGQKFQVET